MTDKIPDGGTMAEDRVRRRKVPFCMCGIRCFGPGPVPISFRVTCVYLMSRHAYTLNQFRLFCPRTSTFSSPS
jgi:hypothetical protein